jgi:hypothetical protein
MAYKGCNECATSSASRYAEILHLRAMKIRRPTDF